MAKVEYRSAQRSRTLIKSALLSLMKDKDFERITITELCAKAGITRGTFYAHYKNMSEVLDSIMGDTTQQLSAIFSDLDAARLFRNSEEVLSACVDFIKKDPEYYRMMLALDNGKHMLEQWKSNVIGFIEASTFLTGRGGRMGQSYRCAVNFVINGVVESLTDSLLGKNGIALEALPRELSRLIDLVMAPFLGR